MALTWDTAVPPFPLTAGFTANVYTAPMQRLVLKLALAPGSYQLSVLPDLMVLTSAVGAVTPDDVNEFMPEVLISSARVVRTVNWWDASGVFHSGENQVAQLQTSPDTLATQAMLDAGITAHYGDFSYYTTTVAIEPQKTVTYSSGARDVYTADYYLLIDGWNVSYPQQPSETDVALSGRFLVTSGNPTGQRTQSWGGDWLNVQSLFTTYQPPDIPPLPPPPEPPPPPPALDPQHLPAVISWTPTSDGYGVQSQAIADSAPSTWWRDFGDTVFSGYGSQVLSALRDLANGTGYYKVGAALDVVNAASTAASVREFLNGLVEKSMAKVAEGAQLIMNPNTTAAQARDFFARGVQMDRDAQEGLRDQATSIVADQVIPGGGMVHEVFLGGKQASQTNSFVLEAVIPGLPVTGGDKVDVVWGGSRGETISTLGGNDAVMGFGGDDIISGGDGRDWLAGGAGNDSLDGGADLDVALYAGGKSGYTILKTGQGFSVSGPDGFDTLTGIERLMFADTGVALDVEGTGGKAYRIYQAAFDRTPDTGGLGFWIKVLDDGAALRDVAQGFMGSPEFQLAYGTNPSNAQLVSKFYENVLHRPPDEGGYAYWLGILNQGLDTAAGALANISESPENQAGVIGAIQNGFEYMPYG